MSGHSKWHSIKHKKGAADAKRGKIFTKHAKLITIAARDGVADPEMNPGLRSAIINARGDNVPNANIEKAIKKGSGDDKDAAAFVEIMYEGFGPCGTAVLVQSITDNKNRALTSIKTAFNKNGGNFGEAGTVGWMFDRKGLILAKAPEGNADDIEMMIIEAGAEDLDNSDGEYEITTADSDLMKVRDELEKQGFEVKKAELTYLPQNPVKIETLGDAQKVLKFIDALEDDEEVANVYSNFDIPEEFLEQI
ncbi:YebC/PmpR family DNA-binding transcriptional regulator [Patescibacteria group bacterium]|nr:YebC/PmpR family DNA-binding transcriptional regulator [Patescibacteria group bacterium]